MKQIKMILLLLLMLTSYVAEVSPCSSPTRSEQQNLTASDEDKAIECEALKVIRELSESAPATTFYHTVQNGVEALTFVQQLLLKHTKNLIMTDGKTYTYVYESPLLKVVYTEDKNTVRGIAEAMVYFKTSKTQYKIVFNI